ncbi:class I mannose-6-phosphate isomerase [Candidatus Sumerlaeota bacterium]|nr:class I mannose-6-phosphate isomerase [Candidatus Sumerlaeota bacterium]
MQTYPLLSQPIFKEKIWGGRRLERWFADQMPADVHIGEIWTIADLKEGSSAVANGPLAGKTLSEVREIWGRELIGTAWPDHEPRFPLLVKFLDAHEKLSVQVHPSEEDCLKHFPNGNGKDETWIVLESEHGFIYYGFQPGVDINDYDWAMSLGAIEKRLRHVEVKPGDCFRIQPGTVHAICGGVMTLEIQQPSDTTFRIFDYGRTDDEGNPRPMHYQESRKVIRFNYDENPALNPERVETKYGALELLIEVEAYRIERAQIEKSLKWEVDPRTAQTLVVLEGAGELSGGGEKIALKPGSTAILPASLGSVKLTPEKTGGMLIVIAGASGAPLLHQT